jgi:hypothetical protein
LQNTPVQADGTGQRGDNCQFRQAGMHDETLQSAGPKSNPARPKTA